MKKLLLDILFPPKCAFCGALSATSICPACEQDLPRRPEGGIMEKAGPFPCAVTFYYEDMVVTGIHALKFQGKSGRAGIFASFLAQTAAEQLGGQFDAVTFVPVSPRRRFQRGYDQSRLLAEGCCRLWNVKAEKALRKIRNNPPQSSVRSFAERRANVLGAYSVCPGAKIADRRFLLIDDVFTTGSTLEACAGTLMEAGAASVVCAALAGGHRRQENP